MSLDRLSKHAMLRIKERHARHLEKYESELEFGMECYRLFNAAELSMRHLNDTRFMVWIQERYGFHQTYRFKQYKNMVFVINGNVCVTVLDSNSNVLTRQHARTVKC